jgi:hypothetical protein
VGKQGKKGGYIGVQDGENKIAKKKKNPVDKRVFLC